MAVVEGPRSASLISRVQNILMKPAAEWDVIDGEAATIPGLFTGYACILAAIGPWRSSFSTSYSCTGPWCRSSPSPL